MNKIILLWGIGGVLASSAYLIVFKSKLLNKSEEEYYTKEKKNEKTNKI